MQHRTFKKIAYYFAFGLLTLFLFSPVVLKFCTNSWDENGLTFLRPLLICFAIVSSCLLVKHRVLSIIVLTIFAFTTICEWVMVSNYGSYMDIDLFIAFATTNWEEGTRFAVNNLHALWYIIPILLLFVALCILYVRSVLPTLRVRVTTWVICISVAIAGIMPTEKFSSMHHISDVKIALFKNIFTTPPLNIFHLSKIAVRQIQRSKQTNDFSFQSVRTQQVAGKEVYVLAIGESVRDTTERPEAVEAGTVLLVGTNREKIEHGVSMLLDDAEIYRRMSEAVNPYGDGMACERIAQYLFEF